MAEGPPWGTHCIIMLLDLALGSTGQIIKCARAADRRVLLVWVIGLPTGYTGTIMAVRIWELHAGNAEFGAKPDRCLKCRGCPTVTWTRLNDCVERAA